MTISRITDDTTFSVHIDCDNVWVYETELGMKLPFTLDYMYDVSLTRLLDLFDTHRIKATFFIIGRDLELEACRRFCAEALARGHALGNHSLNHPMYFGSMNAVEREVEIRRCHEEMVKHTGVTCKAFRAPGYGVSDSDMKLLADLGYLYDSSVLPGPTAMLIKMMTWSKKAYRKKSLNVWQNFFSTAHALQHAVSEAQKIWRIPVAVMPYFRLPTHTSFAFLLGSFYLKCCLSLLHRSKGHHVMLLHGLDLADDVANTQDGTAIPIAAKPYMQRFAIVEEMLTSIAPKTVQTEDLLVPSGSQHR
jgi:peptidoglycan/xylan/chitin deacetylase (PgdA/CDA1 family)